MVIILLSCGCSIKQENSVTTVARESSTEPEVYFCPADNCSMHLIDFISSAREYLHCAFYDIDLPEVIAALKERADEIDVRIVVDNDNYEGAANLDFARKDTSSQLSHNKFCVADDFMVFTGSFNPTFNDDRKNNNNIIVINSRYLAQNYENEFAELWNGEFGKGADVLYPVVYLNDMRIENYFCPEDKCAEHVIDALRNAKQSIYFMAFTFTDSNIANMLALKMEEGVDVRGLFEKTRKNEWTKFDFLQGQGADVMWDSNRYVMHHKVFLIDNSTVVTGSMNPTWSADNENDENILIIHDKGIASEFLDEFEKIFKQ